METNSPRVRFHSVPPGASAMVLFLAGVVFAGGTGKAIAQTDRHIEIVSASASVRLEAVVLTTPEEWKKAVLFRRGASSSQAVVVKYPGIRYHWFTGNSEAPTDVLYVTSTGQITGILKNANDDHPFGICEEVAAAVYLPGGFSAAHGIEEGNLVVSSGFQLGGTTEASPKDLSAQRDQMLRELQRGVGKGKEAAVLQLGECYLEHRMFFDAEKLFQSYLKRASSSDIQIGLAQSLSGAGKVEEAITVLASVVANDSKNEQAFLQLARIFRFVQKIDGIVAILATGISRNPEMLSLRLELAKLYLRMGALENATQLLDGAPTPSKMESAQISRVRGDVLLRAGKMKAAASAYRQYLDVFRTAPHGAELRLFVARHLEPKSSEK